MANRDPKKLLDGQAELPSEKEVVAFWFPDEGLARQSFWFTKAGSLAQRQVDETISGRFGALLLSQEGRALTESWSSSGEPIALLAAVLVLDQFSRHLFRDRPGEFQRLTWKAHTAAESLLQLPHSPILSSSNPASSTSSTASLWPLPYRLFALMPLRHVRSVASIHRLQDVLSQISQEELSPALRDLLQAYEKATAQCLAEVTTAHTSGFDMRPFWDVLEFPILPFLAPFSPADLLAMSKTPLYDFHLLLHFFFHPFRAHLLLFLRSSHFFTSCCMLHSASYS